MQADDGTRSRPYGVDQQVRTYEAAGGWERGATSVGWERLSAVEWRVPRERHTLPALAHDVLVLSLAPGGRVRMRVEGERAREVAQVPAGHIVFWAAGRATDWDVEGGDQVVQLYLPSSMLRQDVQSAFRTDLRALELPPVLAGHDPDVELLARLLVDELHHVDEADPLRADMLAAVLAVAQLRAFSHAVPQRAGRDGRLVAGQVRRVTEFIRSALDRPIRLADLATVAGVSPTHLPKAFRQAFGVAPHRYVLEQRVALARRLLARPALAIPEIAWRTGFSSQSHLTTAFRRITGTTPARWRRDR